MVSRFGVGMRVGVRELPSMVWTGTMVVSAEAGMRMFESGSFSAVVAGVDVTVTCGCSGCNWAWIDVVMMLISSEGSGGMLRVGNAMDVPGMVTTWGAWEVVLLVTAVVEGGREGGRGREEGREGGSGGGRAI